MDAMPARKTSATYADMWIEMASTAAQKALNLMFVRIGKQ
jgi:hypothetical protein